MKKIIILSESQIFSKYLYHGTGIGQVLRIQESGFLMPNATGEQSPSISFSAHFDFVKKYAAIKHGHKAVILRTLHDNSFQLSSRIANNDGYEYITFEPIPVDELEILYNNNWEALKHWNLFDF